MKLEESAQPEEEKIDLKHDTMEFSASTDGDDQIEDSLDFEEDEITAEELDAIEDAPEDEEAAALNQMETERMVDVDNLPEEDWTDDLNMDDDDDSAEPDHHRGEK